MKTIEQTINIAGIIFTIKDVILIIPFLLTVVGAIYLAIKTNIRFSQNLKRPVLFLSLDTDKTCDLTLEKEIIKKAKFKMTYEAVQNIRKFESGELQEYSCLIIGFQKDKSSFEELIKVLSLVKSNQNIPVIIYTFGTTAFTPDQYNKIYETYSLYSMANVPLRLISDLFNILAIYPNGK